MEYASFADAIRSNLTPEATAVVADRLRGTPETGDEAADQGVAWLRDELARIMGGPESVDQTVASLHKG